MSELASLTRDAIDAGYSATGRPSWLEAHAGDVESGWVTARIVESPGVLRCLVTIRPQAGDMVAFTLDVSRKSFDRLPTITSSETVELLHQMLASAPFLPLEATEDPT